MQALAIQADIRRYAQLVENALRNTAADPPVAMVRAMLNGDLAEPQTPPPISTGIVPADTVQVRPVYVPLFVYSWLSTFRLRYETLPRQDFGRWEERLYAWSESVEPALERARLPEGSVPAAIGDRAAQAVWSALALHVAGKIFVRDAWTDLASEAFGRLTRAQQVGGNFLLVTGAEHPEAVWYHELAILHAAASYAVQAEDRTVAASVRRATEFHLAQTQPDHATAQPWGIFAFIWNEQTRPLADAMLHSVTLQQQSGGFDAVSLILLADALYCLRLFL